MYRVRHCSSEIDKMIKRYEDFCKNIGMQSTACDEERVQTSMSGTSRLENSIVIKKKMEADIEEKLAELEKLKAEITKIIKQQEHMDSRKKMILFMYFVDCMSNAQIARFFELSKRTVILEKNDALNHLISPPHVIK